MSLAAVAGEAGVSRSVLARRFSELVGEPPMQFVTSWRIELGADLVGRAGTTIGANADGVGYSSPLALSTAFKRVRGISLH